MHPRTLERPKHKVGSPLVKKILGRTKDLTATTFAAPCLAYGQRAVTLALEFSPALSRAMRRTEHMCAPFPLQQGGRSSAGRFAAKAASKGTPPKISTNRAASVRRKTKGAYSNSPRAVKARNSSRSADRPESSCYVYAPVHRLRME